MTFQEKLVILRKTRGLTQDEFASAVGVSRQAVYKWESGQSYPEVQKLLEIKTLFSISIDNLLDDSYDVPTPEKKKRKRISKETKERIEKSVEKSETAAPAPKAAPAVVVTETVEAATPVKETETPEKDPFNIVVKEEEVTAPKEEPKSESVPEKKTGFFDRLFGRK